MFYKHGETIRGRASGFRVGKELATLRSLPGLSGECFAVGCLVFDGHDLVAEQLGT